MIDPNKHADAVGQVESLSRELHTLKREYDEQKKTATELFDHLKDSQAEVADLKARIHRLEGPFTCHHAPDYVGGACAACHANLIDALESVGRQAQSGTIKITVENALKSVTWKKGAGNGPRKE